MPTNIFPPNNPQRIRLNLPANAGSTPSWRVLFSKEVVPVADATNTDAADDEGYFPINAAYAQADGCRPQIGQDSTVYNDDGLSRCSLYLQEATIDPSSPETLQAAQLVEFKIKITIEGIGGTLFHGAFVVPIKGASSTLNARSQLRGLLATVSGVLGTQFEVWARVKNIVNPQPVEVRFQMIMDRLGDTPFAYPGNPTAGGTDLPLPCCTGSTGPTGLTGGK